MNHVHLNSAALQDILGMGNWGFAGMLYCARGKLPEKTPENKWGLKAAANFISAKAG